MASNDPSEFPFAEFIDDYFVECEEHLAVARRDLLALESFVDRPQVDRSLLDELFRSFHSIKGLSAMVGVRAAEQLAHELEAFLGVLRKGRVLLTAEGLDALMAGVKALEETIAARRQQTTAPPMASLLAQLAFLAGGTPAVVQERPASSADDEDALSLKPDEEALIAAARARGERVWRFTFMPSPELAGRGINVNTVRQRLQESGELIHAMPLATAGGQIAFAFLVASRADEAVFAPWREDGLTYQSYEAAGSAETVPPAPVVAAGPTLAASHLVRVDLSRLDELMRMVGELVISRARLDDNLKRLGAELPAMEWRALQETNQALERQLRDLREGVMRVRMVPVREVFARMQFVVRDLAREFGKKATLELSGQQTEIDKFVVERMMDPLLHLVRNAVSHALEPPEERVARGKPPEGRIALRARTTGETVTIEVEDDGRGIDEARVFARARAAGLMVADGPADAAALRDIICSPGFSTRDEADRASGRGVGMAVVRTVVEELGGTLALDTEVGRGTRFTIQLPLTLAIADALVVMVRGQRYAVPQVSVREVIQVGPTALTILENNELLSYRGGVLPLVRLSRFFALAEAPDGPLYALVTGDGLEAIGIGVDRVLGLREIVVRPLTDSLVRVPGIAGATELGDGRVVLILDALALARAARHSPRIARGVSLAASPN